MRYHPHTPEDVREMLDLIGVHSIEDLFSTIPLECRREMPMELPPPLSEWELNAYMDSLSSTIATSGEYTIFLGAGSYDHYIPEIIPYLIARSEFLTSYTPYQPEISQGTLQALFEYQTYIARLLGMDIANASLYDGASALAEALLMALRLTQRKTILVSRLIHPHYRQVVATYLRPTGAKVVEIPYLEDGTTDQTYLHRYSDIAAVALQSPNFFGCIENIADGAAKAHAEGALLVCCFTEPLAYGLFRNPGSQDADIVCGEGQSFGVPASYGGPGLGMFAARKEYMRSMPGRLVGQTVDADGRRGFVLTLSAREQHIRREKATSNICTNNNLCAMIAVMYLASLGGTGLRNLATLNYDKAHYLRKQLAERGFVTPFSTTPSFNEFVVRCPPGFEKVYERLYREKKIVMGLPLEPLYPECPDHYLVCVTETKSKEDIDRLVEELVV